MSKTDEFKQRLIQFCFVESRHLSLSREQIAEALTKVGEQLKKNTDFNPHERSKQ